MSGPVPGEMAATLDRLVPDVTLSIHHERHPGQPMRAQDLIGDVLRSVRLAGTLYFEAVLRAPWAIRMEGADHASFHRVGAGSCWLSIADGDWIELAAGETIVLSPESPHVLSSEPGAEVIDGRALFGRLDDSGVARIDGPGPSTRLICGHFSYDRELSHPLLDALPRLLRADADRLPGWAAVTELAVARSKDIEPGAQALTDRLAEVLLIEVLREVERSRAGYLAALSDPAVAAALHAMHADPARAWTVASLAAEVATSRSSLAARFSELVGESPMRYLTRWRMLVATRLLADTALPAARIAEMVGYATPFSFTKAFSRELGQPPTSYRARLRSSSNP